MSKLKVTQCQGEGQGSCKRCNDNGKWNRAWMDFLYKVEGYEGCYCRDCVKELQKEQEENKADKYLSIITNFGCHYTCPYCVVKNNHLDMPKTTLEGLNNLNEAIQENNINIISLSDGGDPLYQYKDNKDWYDRLYSMTDLPLEMHTSYVELPEDFSIERYTRIVYHLRALNELHKIKRHGKEIVRVVFVVTAFYTEEYIDAIADYVKNSPDIDELSFRQLIDDSYTTQPYLQEYLIGGHQRRWWYIEQCDYNLYYTENQVYTSYKELGKYKEEE